MRNGVLILPLIGVCFVLPFLSQAFHTDTKLFSPLNVNNILESNDFTLQLSKELGVEGIPKPSIYINKSNEFIYRGVTLIENNEQTQLLLLKEALFITIQYTKLFLNGIHIPLSLLSSLSSPLSSPPPRSLSLSSIDPIIIHHKGTILQNSTSPYEYRLLHFFDELVLFFRPDLQNESLPLLLLKDRSLSATLFSPSPLSYIPPTSPEWLQRFTRVMSPMEVGLSLLKSLHTAHNIQYPKIYDHLSSLQSKLFLPSSLSTLSIPFSPSSLLSSPLSSFPPLLSPLFSPSLPSPTVSTDPNSPLSPADFFPKHQGRIPKDKLFLYDNTSAVKSASKRFYLNTKGTVSTSLIKHHPLHLSPEFYEERLRMKKRSLPSPLSLLSSPSIEGSLLSFPPSVKKHSPFIKQMRNLLNISISPLPTQRTFLSFLSHLSSPNSLSSPLPLLPAFLFSLDPKYSIVNFQVQKWLQKSLFGLPSPLDKYPWTPTIMKVSLLHTFFSLYSYLAPCPSKSPLLSLSRLILQYTSLQESSVPQEFLLHSLRVNRNISFWKAIDRESKGKRGRRDNYSSLLLQFLLGEDYIERALSQKRVRNLFKCTKSIEKEKRCLERMREKRGERRDKRKELEKVVLHLYSYLWKDTEKKKNLELGMEATRAPRRRGREEVEEREREEKKFCSTLPFRVFLKKEEYEREDVLWAVFLLFQDKERRDNNRLSYPLTHAREFICNSFLDVAEYSTQLWDLLEEVETYDRRHVGEMCRRSGYGEGWLREVVSVRDDLEKFLEEMKEVDGRGEEGDGEGEGEEEEREEIEETPEDEWIMCLWEGARSVFAMEGKRNYSRNLSSEYFVMKMGQRNRKRIFAFFDVFANI